MNEPFSNLIPHRAVAVFVGVVVLLNVTLGSVLFACARVTASDGEVEMKPSCRVLVVASETPHTRLELLECEVGKKRCTMAVLKNRGSIVKSDMECDKERSDGPWQESD